MVHISVLSVMNNLSSLFILYDKHVVLLTTLLTGLAMEYFLLKSKKKNLSPVTFYCQISLLFQDILCIDIHIIVGYLV